MAKDIPDYMRGFDLDEDWGMTPVSSAPTTKSEPTIDKKDIETQKRFKEIEKIILPFLYNLQKTDEPYIHWPNRGPIIKAQIEKLLKLTRG